MDHFQWGAFETSHRADRGSEDGRELSEELGRSREQRADRAQESQEFAREDTRLYMDDDAERLNARRGALNERD
jgi:hypothetical protein